MKKIVKKDVITTIDKKTVLTESLVKESESKNVKTEILSDKNSKKIVSDKEVENTQIEEKKKLLKMIFLKQIELIRKQLQF